MPLCLFLSCIFCLVRPLQDFLYLRHRDRFLHLLAFCRKSSMLSIASHESTPFSTLCVISGQSCHLMSQRKSSKLELVLILYCVSFPSWRHWGSPSIYCSCTLINAFHWVGLEYCACDCFHYPATWAATCSLQRICLHFWSVDAVLHGAYHGWK